METESAEVPGLLVNDRGQVRYGLFNHSLARINAEAAVWRSPFGRVKGPLARRFGYKQFQYFGIVSEHLMAGCALVNTGWLGMVFFYVFDPLSGRLDEQTWRSPLGGQPRLGDSPRQGRSVFRKSGVEVAMDYSETPDGGLEKSLTLVTAHTRLAARMAEPPTYQPMSICTRTGFTGWTYANKVAARPLTGTLVHRDQTHDLAAMDAWGHHDFSAGFMRRETWWNWACFSGRAGGRAVGLNVSCGVNETAFSENCLWLDDRLVKVGGVYFDYDGDELMAPWRVHSQDERVDLRFEPLGRHRERLNLGLFGSNFHQIFGRFRGTIRDEHDAPLQIENLHGFVEEQYARW